MSALKAKGDILWRLISVPGNFTACRCFLVRSEAPASGLSGRTFDFSQTPRRKVAGVRFLSNAKQLQALPPKGFRVWSEPVVTIEIGYMTDIGWLAGRGYNMCDVRFEAVYEGKGEPIYGTLVLARWENLADPIVSGREELGHNKIYCEIPEMRTLDGNFMATMSWLSTPFLDVSLSDLIDHSAPSRDPRHAGMLSYKYIPKTGEWRQYDVGYATLSPHAAGPITTLTRKEGSGNPCYDSCVVKRSQDFYSCPDCNRQRNEKAC
ncbi:acetoacetate decarboxylase family protein [Bosea sp. 2KB_26]|uniref:acetoacetate decarboxylase family protein n=1 Tax=Bosea sp. 2KB_26 TaxID=3237475 RepID=UPI003F90DA93